MYTPYLDTLIDELTDARRRLARASPEAVPVVSSWIREIQRDIARYSVNAGERAENESVNRYDTA